MKPVLTLILSATLALSAPAAFAKPHLRDVAKIDNSLMYLGIADELRKGCDNIGARMLRALNYVNSLKSEARKLGYSADEIEDYVTSKAEKRRMRAKATQYLKSKGVQPGDKAAF